ncbi:MAG: DNA mismatch repair endonuclease MutL [Lachnospiraceae bacterium]|nr:DNA mismatch repair endonuclease MutL [Lachnospiraceae bacterium]
MRPIRELDPVTVDQIAAGEVIERPANAVKELVENAIDAGASAITVEIEDGGITMIRITDNGTGIPAKDVKKAFLRHATSKITSIGDLASLHSLGFRGEALSSITAVARVEMITKVSDALTGTRYRIEGGNEISCEEVGAPDGTTIIVRNLFYNTPARGKFLKKPQTEATHVADLAEHLALAHPEISFRFISNHQDRFHTSGNGDLKENIYRIYGRDTAASLLPIDAEKDGVHVSGYLGKPAINRGSRSFEQFFVNGRYVRDRVLSMAVEEGYRAYLMQHKFPFAVLFLEIPPDEVDVNVHPSKMEVRFRNSFAVSAFLTGAVRSVLDGQEMIPDALLDEKRESALGFGFAEENEAQRYGYPDTPAAEPFERGFTGAGVSRDELSGETSLYGSDSSRPAEGNPESDRSAPGRTTQPLLAFGLSEEPVAMRDDAGLFGASSAADPRTDRILSETGRAEYRILGQIFDTFWVIAWRDQMLLMDQHAAHEKVNYERMMKRYHEHAVLSQLIEPPEILQLTPKEEEMVKRFADIFRQLGFEIEEFGEHTIALRGVPVDLYGADNERGFFLEILDELSEDTSPERDPQAVTGRIAGMACKASVKGNMRMTFEEVNALLDEMMKLENPYNCPHGRPTIISMSRFEIEKRFKRVVD